MKNICFVKEPGYFYDLLFLFVFNFNKEKCITDFKQLNDDYTILGKLAADFGPFCDDLLPFFWLKDQNKCFISQYYYSPYADKLLEKNSFSIIQNDLSKHEQVIENMIKFYFPDITAEKIEECKISPIIIGKLIKESCYSDSIKCSLFAFFLEPEEVIRKLAYELIVKEYLLSQLYEKSLREIVDLQSNFDLYLLVDKLNQCKDQKIDIDPFDKIFVSFCLCMNHCVRIECGSENMTIMLGADYIKVLDSFIYQQCSVQIDLFGNALSEKNRIDILELLLKKQVITIRDIEHELGFSGTNAYYHLSLMIKAKMVKSRNQGRTVLYSINQQSFDFMCGWLSRYSNKEKGGSEV